MPVMINNHNTAYIEHCLTFYNPDAVPLSIPVVANKPEYGFYLASIPTTSVRVFREFLKNPSLTANLRRDTECFNGSSSCKTNQ